MQTLPPPEQLSPGMWTRSFLAVKNAEVFYIIDNIAHLIEARPKSMGSLRLPIVMQQEHDTQCTQSTCQIWQQPAVNKDKQCVQFVCVFVVSDPAGAQTRIFVFRKYKTEAHGF